MNYLGFTGTRQTDAERDRLMEYVGSGAFHVFTTNFDGFVTGGCRGWDALVGEFLALKYPDKEHVVIVPANRSQVDPWWEKFDHGKITLVMMPDGTDYRDRNTQIVRHADQLFYCAEYPEDHVKSKRSGTWMTVRIAQDAGMTVHGITLNTQLEAVANE